METTAKGVDRICEMLDRNETVTLVDVCATFDVDSLCAFEIMETLSELENVNALAVVRVQLANDFAPSYMYVPYDINNKEKHYQLTSTDDNNPPSSVKLLGIVSLSRLSVNKMIASPLELISECYADDVDGDRRWKTRVQDVFVAATRGRTRKVLSIYKHQIDSATMADGGQAKPAVAEDIHVAGSLHASFYGKAALHAPKPKTVEEPPKNSGKRQPEPASQSENPPAVRQDAVIPLTLADAEKIPSTPSAPKNESFLAKKPARPAVAQRKSSKKKSKKDNSTTMTAAIKVLSNLIGDDGSDIDEGSDNEKSPEPSRVLENQNEQSKQCDVRKLTAGSAAVASLMESDFFKNFTGDDDDDDSGAGLANTKPNKIKEATSAKPAKKSRKRQRKSSMDRKPAADAEETDTPEALENNKTVKDADEHPEPMETATEIPVARKTPVNVKVVKTETKREVVQDENGFFVSRIVVETTEVDMADNKPVLGEFDGLRTDVSMNKQAEKTDLARVDKRTPVQPAKKKAKPADGFKQQSLTMFFGKK